MVVESVSSPQILPVDHPESFFYQTDPPVELCGDIPDNQLSCQIVLDPEHGWQVVLKTGPRADVDVEAACATIAQSRGTQKDCQKVLKPLGSPDDSVALGVLPNGKVEFQRSVLYDQPAFDPLDVISAVSSSTTLRPTAPDVLIPKFSGEIDYVVAGILGFIVLFVSASAIAFARATRTGYSDSPDQAPTTDNPIADVVDTRRSGLIAKLLQSKKHSSPTLPTQEPGSKPFVDKNGMPRATPGVANRRNKPQK